MERTAKKTWYTSKTLWVNMIAVGAMFLQQKVGYILSPEDQIAILGVVNVVLRVVTKTELVV
jgi:hypothetical protein